MYSVAFHAVCEDRPGPKWRAVFDRHWPAYRRWFLTHGGHQKVTYLAGLRALRAHMPELVPAYERIVDLAGGGDIEARFLSMWCPPVYIRGCSQAVIVGDDPTLIRNYDYPPALIEGTWLSTRMNERRVVGVSDCLWGVLDGVNESGVAVSLAFGGKRTVGAGFGIPLVMRYVLEFASTTQEAVAHLKRLPVHMCYTVTVIDAASRYATVFMSPGQPGEVTDVRVATNFQHSVGWPEHARATHAVERADILNAAVEAEWSSENMVGAFFTPPVYQSAYERGYGTLYTALYRPACGEASLMWPQFRWSQNVDNFQEGLHRVSFGPGLAVKQDDVLAPLQPTMVDDAGGTIEVTHPWTMKNQ